MAKISSFIIGIILVGFITTSLGLYMSEVNTAYSPTTYNDSALSEYNKLDEMSALADELEGKSELETKTGILDVIGDYFAQAYNAMKITKKSFDNFDDMSNEAIDHLDMGASGQYLRVTIATIILIIIVLGIIISAVIKKDL